MNDTVMMKSLADVCDILDSQRIPVTARDRVKGCYPYYGANGIQDYVDKYIFDDELVLLAEDGGNFGSKESPIAYRVSGKCWVNNHAHVLKPHDNTDVDYLCYALMFYNTEGLVNGATRQKLTQSAMKKMIIPLCDLKRQQEIVNELNAVSHLISLRQRQAEKLDELVKARFVEMFGEGKYGGNPLSNVCKLITDGTHQPPQFVDAGIPFLLVSNLVHNEITYDTEKFISKESYQELIKRTPVEIGDILLSIVGSYGHAGVVRTDKPFCFQRHIAYIKPDFSKLNSEFLHYALLSDAVKYQMEKRVKGIAQKTLNLSELKKIVVPIPPLALQTEFSHFVHEVDREKERIQRSAALLETLKRSLMQQYFG